MQINQTLYRFGDFPSGIILGIKSALEALNFCSGYVAHPHRQFDGKTYEEIKKYVVELHESIKNYS